MGRETMAASARGRRPWTVTKIDGEWHVRQARARESRAVCEREAEALFIAAFLSKQDGQGGE